jgi:Ca2+-binding RTX toxin-like protein
VTVDIAAGTATGDASVGSDTFTDVSRVRGSNFDDTISGGAGFNVLEGQGGNDTIQGRGGNDTLTGGAGNDTFVYVDGDGADIITDFVAGASSPDKIDLTGVSGVHSLADILALATQNGSSTVISFGGGNTITLQNVTLSNLNADDFIFATHLSNLADTFSGDANTNTVFGGAGDDQIFGAGGNDFLAGEEGNDIIQGGDGNDVVHGDSDGSVIAGDDYLQGNAGDDVLFGDCGNDRMVGGIGNDTLMGGVGGDFLVGNEGADIFRYTAAEESQNIVINGANQLDQIADFTQGQDKIDLSAIDANPTLAGDQAFTFIADPAHYTGDWTGVVWETTDARTGIATINVSTDGDSAPEMQIYMSHPYQLTASDFIL